MIDFKVIYPNAAIDIPLAQPRQHQLVTQRQPELAELDAVKLQATVQLSHINLVLSCDALLGQLNRRIVHFDARLARELQLHAVVDEAFQHLAQQCLAIALGTTLLSLLLGHTGQLQAHLVVGDGLGIHHGHYEISRRGGFLERCGGGFQALRLPRHGGK